MTKKNTKYNDEKGLRICNRMDNQKTEHAER